MAGRVLLAMSKANWADEDESDEDISPEQALQDKLLNQVEKSRGAAPRKENRDRSGSNVSSGSQGDRTRRRGHHDQPGGGGARGGYRNDRSGDGYDGSSRQQGVPNLEVPKYGPYIAYVGNLSYSSSAQTVGEYFVGGGCDVTACKILADRDGRPRGYANVTFGDRKSLISALDADNTELDGRNITVRVDRRSGTDRKRDTIGLIVVRVPVRRRMALGAEVPKRTVLVLETENAEIVRLHIQGSPPLRNLERRAGARQKLLKLPRPALC